MKTNPLKIGTCSWKYDSWIGLIYSEEAKKNYLKEYSQTYSTVEIDQWFWSSYPGSPPKLPDRRRVEEYAQSVPDDFKFSIKVPNSLTLTHFYKTSERNPHFLSVDLFHEFLDTLSPMKSKIGPLIFQFEYLNKKKMPNLELFINELSEFFNECPEDYSYAIECRNPNYLIQDYFLFLQVKGLSHVFLQGYYMPPIWKVYEIYKQYPGNQAVIRLHGPNRKEIEEATGKNWNEIVDPKDEELQKILPMISDLISKETEVYLNINNHYEGSAPLTITKLKEIL